MSSRKPVADRFPVFPWDTLAEAKALASEYPGGIADLSIGTPVDDSPALAQVALAAASNAPGYPTVFGPESLRQAVIDWLERRFGVTGLAASQVLPTIGSKEFIANLPIQLGLGATHTVAFPTLAYPTYEVGAKYANCAAVAVDEVSQLSDSIPDLLFINSPANPHGKVLELDQLREIVTWCRANNVLLVSDECYLEFVWEGEAWSVLHPEVNGGSIEGILAVHSLSKRSNLAGYRDAFVVGDPQLIAELLQARKHLGLMLPAPVAAAMTAILGDDAHVDLQRERYTRRRAQLRAALEGAGFEISYSQGSLYLWATQHRPGRETVHWLAQRGILVAPGEFYGAAGNNHVRVAFTATDDVIFLVTERLR